MMRIVLASQSPRRKKLLQQIGLAFEIYPSNAEEISAHTDPELLVEDLAALKAEDVASRFSESLVIGSDTIVVHNGEVLGKPKNETEAAAFLQQLSGTDHFVYTGVAFVKTDKKGTIQAKHTFNEQTKVTFSTLGEHEINAYIKNGNPLDKAGAYGIQDDVGALFVEKIVGDYYNIVGFPLNRFYREIKSFIPEFDIMTS